MNRLRSFLTFQWLKTNAKIVAFLSCVLIASGIWMINALNKTQHATLEVKVVYNETWLRAWASGNQQPTIKMEVSGRGFDLAQFLLANKNHKVEITEKGLFAHNEKLSATDLLHPIFEAFGNSISLDKITPEWILLPSRKNFFRKVAIHPDYKIQLKDQFMVSGPAVSVPDSIWLSSVTPFPDSLVSINSTVIAQNNVEKPVFHSAGIQLPKNEKIIPEYQSVWIYIPVEQSTECVLTVPLHPTGINAQNMQVIPAGIDITCRVPISRFDITVPERFTALAIVSATDQKKAFVEIAKAPSWAENITWKPATVNFIYQSP